ncbi:unnamed protein product [Caenorhabditis brenneri]
MSKPIVLLLLLLVTQAASFNLEHELAKFTLPRFSSEETIEFCANNMMYQSGDFIFRTPIPTIETIGLQELRSALNFGQPPTLRRSYEIKDPKAATLATAPNLKAYYEMKEPGSFLTTFDAQFLYQDQHLSLENSMTQSVSYFDRKFPIVRSTYRQAFEDTLQTGPLDTDMIDQLLRVYDKILVKGLRVYSKLADC